MPGRLESNLGSGIITEIAFRIWLWDISSFNRSFKEAFGLARGKYASPDESEQL